MKKLFLGFIGIIVLCLVAMNIFHNEITDQYNPLVKEDWVYVKTSESGKISTMAPGSNAGDYKLSGYYSSGEQREVVFYSPRGLREGAYVKVKTKGLYIETYEEVQPNDVPKDIKNKLDK